MKKLFIKEKKINISDLLFGLAYLPWIYAWMFTSTYYKDILHPYAIIKFMQVFGIILLLLRLGLKSKIKVRSLIISILMIIYVITHKKFEEKCKSSVYQPILVGAALHDIDVSYLKDNSKNDNISDKNSSYCELTGIYWIWKHSKDDIVGVCHYRRYFSNSRYYLSALKEKQIRQILNKYDIIVPKKNSGQYNGHTAKEFFSIKHDERVWDECLQIIKEKTPQYVEDFKWFENEKSGYCFNMCIMDKEKFDNYCQWLFGILFELEKKIDLSCYDGYNTRMYGFVSERLINVWIHHENLSVKEMPVYFTDKGSVGKRVMNKIKWKLGLRG